MNFLNKLSLRTKIISMVVFCSSMITVGGLYAFHQFADSYKEKIISDAENDAKSLGAAIAAQFYERYGDIQAFAMNPKVKSLDVKDLPNILDDYVKLYGIYDVILVVDKNGHYVASNTKDTSDKSINFENLKKFNYANLSWFQSAMNEKFTEDKSKNFTGTLFEDIHLDSIYDIVYGYKQSGTSFTTVIKNDKGEKVGVITNRTNNKWFETEMVHLYQERKEAGFDDYEVTILNKDGFVISELAPKHHNGKIEFDKDYEKHIFKKNMFQEHQPAGEKMTKKASGASFSKENGEEAFDLVGYYFLDNTKWINSIGWTIMGHEDKDAALKAEVSAQRNFYFISGIIVFLSVVLATWFSVLVSKSINSVTLHLSSNSKDLSDASIKIASQATELSEAATEQAAALQETVAAVDEISAMVDKNSEAALKSKDVSAQSREAALRGRQTVENMIHAINEINSSNEEISYQMNQSNKQLSEITKLINDIGSKTKVINEIVFQTKLLSFNASVEAARAGEYGKGFAVVAEEVGNLAQMSGNAAKEITEMLDQSVRQVESIVSETKVKVERLMSASKEKVEAGAETAKECNAALDEILSNVSSVDSLVSEIAVASQEQSTGIREISKAVGQMEEVTQQNSAVAQSSSSAAEQLSSQSVELNGIVNDLVHVIHGEGSSNINTNSFAMQSKPKVKFNKKSDNIVAFSKNKKSQRKLDEELPSQPSYHNQMKQVAGGEFTPSSDDPGFES